MDATQPVSREQSFLSAMPALFVGLGVFRSLGAVFTLATIGIQRGLLSSFGANADQQLFGGLFESVHLLFLALAAVGLISGGLFFAAAGWVERRVSYRGALAAAVVLAMPLGSDVIHVATALIGAFAVWVLSRPAVRESFAR